MYTLLKEVERGEEMKKSWVKVGEDVGLIVVNDDDVEQEEEDREVEWILAKGKEAMLRLLRGMTMPTPPPPPPPTPQPAGAVEEQAATAVPMEVAGVSGVSPVKKEGASSEPVVVVVEG